MKKIIALAMAVCLSLPVQAKPAPWYKWRSKLDGKTACAQTSLGKGWIREPGLYRDARCEVPGKR